MNGLKSNIGGKNGRQMQQGAGIPTLRIQADTPVPRSSGNTPVPGKTDKVQLPDCQRHHASYSKASLALKLLHASLTPIKSTTSIAMETTKMVRFHQQFIRILPKLFKFWGFTS